MTIVCKNCNNHFKGKFCNHCGQSADTHDINFHYLWHEVQHGILHFDSGIFYTTKQLFTRPGHAIREFINGKRVQFFKPVAFVFLASTIYGLLVHYFNIKNLFDDIEIKPGDLTTPGSKELLNNVRHTLSWLRDHYAYIVVVSLPITSLGSYLAFRKQRINYLKHLILNSYITGQQKIIAILFAPIQIFTGSGITDFFIHVENIIVVLFITWTYVQFFKGNSVLKNILLTVLTFFYLLLILFGLGIGLADVFLK